MGGKFRFLLGVVPVLATLFVGCASNVKQLGSIGDTKFYRVKSSTFAGPNFSALVTSKCDETPRIEQVFGGPGLGPTTISAIGQVGSSAVLGTSFPRIPKNVGDNINVSGGNSGAQATGGTGGASSSVANSSSSASPTTTVTGGSRTHPDSPGNGGVPGNGGQNGNGSHP